VLPKMCHRSLLRGLGEEEPPPSTTATFKLGISILQKKKIEPRPSRSAREEERTHLVNLLALHPARSARFSSGAPHPARSSSYLPTRSERARLSADGI
jgi:hypothetical protein